MGLAPIHTGIGIHCDLKSALDSSAHFNIRLGLKFRSFSNMHFHIFKIAINI